MTTTSIDERGSRRALERLDGPFELGMIALGLVWLGLVTAALVATLPWVLAHMMTAIWAVFAADFAARLVLAVDRRAHLRDNWLTLAAVAVPVLRICRLGRAMLVIGRARAARGLGPARAATTSAQSSPKIHTALLRGHALGYVIGATIAVAFLGGAALYWLERGSSTAFESYGHALWSTAMLIMTMGTGAWPETVAARILTVVLALYGFAMLGYLTACLASWFIGRNHARAGAATLAPRQQA
jgi:voltage-gated potassium channel